MNQILDAERGDREARDFAAGMGEDAYKNLCKVVTVMLRQPGTLPGCQLFPSLG